MTFVYNDTARQLGSGEITYLTDDIQVLLVMTLTDADTLVTANFLSDFALDEMDGANYARLSLGTKTIFENTGSVPPRSEYRAGDSVFPTLGAGARDIQAAVIFRQVTTDADSPPIAYYDGAPLPAAGNGGNFTIQWDAAGAFQIRSTTTP